MKTTLDPTTEALRRAVAAHFDPRTGSPYWLRRERELDLDARARVRALEDLRELGPCDPRDLLAHPLEELVPRGAWVRRAELRLAESGGTTGRPTRCVYTEAEFHAAFGEPFRRVAEALGLPRGVGWLFVGPSGPHPIAEAARLFARERDALEPFRVDLDPRWARAQTPGSLGEALYREHVLDQALDVIARERPGALFATPPVARALAHELGQAERLAVRALHLGGMAIAPEEELALRRAFPSAIVLAGYGNSMFGLLMEAGWRPRGDPASWAPRELDYFPLPGRLHVRVAREDEGDPALAPDVKPGQRGRVVLSRLDETFLLPNAVERDRATAVRAPEVLRALGFAPTGVRDPRPVRAEELEGGLY